MGKAYVTDIMVDVSVRGTLIAALRNADSLFCTDDVRSEELFTYLMVSLKSANNLLKTINKTVPSRDLTEQFEQHNKLVLLQSVVQSLINSIQDEQFSNCSEHSSAYKVGYLKGVIQVVLHDLENVWID